MDMFLGFFRTRPHTLSLYRFNEVGTRFVLSKKALSKAAPRNPLASLLTCSVSSRQAGETIRQAAERTAQHVLLKTATWKGQRDDVAQLHFVGNCPAGWFWRTADEEQQIQSGSFGDKVVYVSCNTIQPMALAIPLYSNIFMFPGRRMG